MPPLERVSAWSSGFLALLSGIAGWHYLFYSRAAQRLSVLEAQPANARRVRLRQANGVAMILLAALLFIGTRGVNPQQSPRTFIAVWLGAMGLLLAIVCLGLMDVLLTVRMRNRRRGPRDGIEG